MARKNTGHYSKARAAEVKAGRKDIAVKVAKMAKTANQRLREIEKHGLTKSSNAYRYVERLAYDEDTATALDSKGRFKWSTNTRGKTWHQLKHELTELDRFLNHSKTSTVKGTRGLYDKAYDTYQANGGKLSRDDYGDMWRMRNIKKLKSMYGSREAVRTVEASVKSGLSLEEIDNNLDELPEDTTLIELSEMAESGKWHTAEGFNPFPTK